MKLTKKGFTLIEMLIVVTIIGILAALIMPRFLSTSDAAKKSAHKADRQHINGQAELYYFNNNAYPSTMDDAGWGTAVESVKYFPDGVPANCNQGTAWGTLANGRIVASPNHNGHE